MKKSLSIFLLFFLFGQVGTAQSKIYNNGFLFDNSSIMNTKDTVYYDRSNYFVGGALSLNIRYPENLKLQDFNQKGFFIGSRQNSSNIDELVLSDVIGLHFNLGSENTFGFTTGTNYVVYQNGTMDTIQHYTGILNLFSYNVNAELIFKLPLLERKIIGGTAITFFNIGATATYMKTGKYADKFFGAVDFVPFYLQFYGKFALKNATFGIGLFANPYNFAEYRFGPKDFVGDNSGIVFNSAQFPKYAFTIYLHFR